MAKTKNEKPTLWLRVINLIKPKSTVGDRLFMAYPTKKAYHNVQAPPDARTVSVVKAGEQVAILSPADDEGEWDNLAFATASKDTNLTSFDMSELTTIKLRYDVEKYKALKAFYAAGLKPNQVSAKFSTADGKPQLGYSPETISIIWRVFNKARKQQSIAENKPKTQ